MNAQKYETTNQTQSVQQSPNESISNAIKAFRRGEFLLVSDDEDRENEGDMVIAAEHATPEAVNFMITRGKGLVCLAVSEEIADQKNLSMMVRRNRDPHGTAFTVSVDGGPEHGITTGISAGERAKTISLIISDEYGPEALRAPGHMFPLIARRGGLRTRQGHTEASVELAKLAGCKPAAAIVEMIKNDGEMARRDDLKQFAEQFGIRYITIKDLTQYIEDRDQEVTEETNDLLPTAA